MKYKFIYDPLDGNPIPDGRLGEVVDRLINSVSKNIIYRFSSKDFLFKIQVEILEGRLSHKDVVFGFNEEELTLNEYARLDHWPDGFCDIDTTLMCKILSLQSKKRKSAREIKVKINE